MEILRATDSRKYLGCLLSGDLKQRGRANLRHRLRCAWAKFGKIKATLIDKHVDVKLRLRLFDAVVTPCALYGLTTAPLTAKDEDQLAVTQRKMLRLIVGYVKHAADSWADMYRRLRTRLESALTKQPIRDWTQTVHAQKRRFIEGIANGSRSSLTCLAASWCPDIIIDPKLARKPARGRGRPRTVWSIT